MLFSAKIKRPKHCKLSFSALATFQNAWTLCILKKNQMRLQIKQYFIEDLILILILLISATRDEAGINSDIFTAKLSADVIVIWRCNTLRTLTAQSSRWWVYKSKFAVFSVIVDDSIPSALLANEINMKIV